MTKETDNRPADIESYKIHINGHQAHYLKTGSGPPVVLLHGGASDSRDWVDTMSALAKDYTLYAPDLLGFGETDRHEEGYYLSDFSDFLKEFVDMLQLGNPFLVGHSFGARVCLEVAFRHPEIVRKLVLIDAAGLGKVTRFSTWIMTAAWAVRKLLGRPQPYPNFLSREGEDLQWRCDGQLPGLKIPTLLIWKRFDPYMPVSIARRTVKLLPGARLVVMPGYGHAPHKAFPDEFNRLLLDYLDGD